MSDALLFAALNCQHDYEDYLEAREAAIDAMVPELAAHLQSDPDFCELAMSELYGDPVQDIVNACGSFFARYKAAETVEQEARAGYALYRLIKPYIEAAANAQAESDARDKVGKA